MSALVMTLRIGDLSTAIGTDKVDLEADVRLLMKWIVGDIRQAKIQELNENVPTPDYIKYNVWVWNNTSLEQDKTNQYVEYEYDDVSQVLTRRIIIDNVTTQEWNFSDITESPFSAKDTSGVIVDDEFFKDTLLGTRRLIVTIRKEKVVRNSPLNFTMAEEIRIRNE